MRRYGLIGFPLSHSFSKKYFAEKFAREGIVDCTYELYPLEEIGLLPELLSSVENLCGLNVTIPYKKQVLPFLDHLSDEVQKIEACNCIAIANGKRYGYNTDTIGFEATFAPQLTLQDKAALVLGTGGAAAAVAYTLAKLGINYTYVSREPTGKPNTILYSALDEEMMQSYTIIINTSPLGTYPAVDDCPAIPYNLLTARHYLYDLVYNPAKTLFLKKGEERGTRIQNGAAMLAIQAEESWKIWNRK